MNIPILVINLDKRLKNFNRILNELKKVELDSCVTRVKAFDKEYAKENKYKYISNKAYENLNNLKSTTVLPTWKSVGCAISHLHCWKMIDEMNLKYCLILEDDFKIENIEKFKFSFNYCLNFIKQQCNMSFISFNSKSNTEYKINNYFNKYSDFFIGTNCYLIDNTCAKYLLNNINQITYQIDVELSKKLRHINNIYFLKKEDSGVSWYDHISDVQYYFITKEELYDTLDLPYELIDNIYSFLPKKQNITNEVDYYY